MTLCLAAVCWDEEEDRQKIVFGADRRAEVAWAGGDVAFKLERITDTWRALIAGEISKAHDLITTCTSILDEGLDDITSNNIFDKFNEASSKHKEKLCRRFVRQRLGIDFDRFLTHGKDELPPDLRARMFHEMAELEYGCEVLIMGFTSPEDAEGVTDTDDVDPQIVEIDRFGEVYVHQNFAAIGTGAVIAKSQLYLREQFSRQSVENTLYHLYEAATLAAHTAPGVGEIDEFVIFNPPFGEDEREIFAVTEKGMKVLDKTFKKIGPKPMIDLARFDADCFEKVVKATSQSDSQTSKGQP